MRGKGNCSVSLVKMPYFDFESYPVLCGIECSNIVTVNVATGEVVSIQKKVFENKSPWYQGAFFMKDKTYSLVAVDEKRKSLRNFEIDIQ